MLGGAAAGLGAGLLLRSFWHLLEVRPGFDATRVVTAKLWLAVPNDPKQDPYRTIEKRAAFHQEVVRRVSSIPGVEAAAVGSGTSLPMSDQRLQLRFAIERSRLAGPSGNERRDAFDGARLAGRSGIAAGGIGEIAIERVVGQQTVTRSFGEV